MLQGGGGVGRVQQDNYMSHGWQRGGGLVSHMGISPNSGPFLGYFMRCRILQGTQKGTLM